MLNLLLPLALVALVHADLQLRLLHRVFDPFADSIPPFTHRATVLISDSPSPIFVPASALAFPNPAHPQQTALYQLALERPGDRDHTHWVVSSVKACHLSNAISDSIVLHTTSERQPYSLDYFIAPIPHDGACPTNPSTTPPSLSNTTVSLRLPHPPPQPALRVPPPLNPDGQPVKVEPEKTFIQKYWMYILLAVLVLLFTSAGGEEESGGGGKGQR